MQAPTTHPAPAACVSDPVKPSESTWIDLCHLAEARAKAAPSWMTPYRVETLERDFGAELDRMIRTKRGTPDSLDDIMKFVIGHQGARISIEISGGWMVTITMPGKAAVTVTASRLMDAITGAMQEAA